ncbi:MAG: prolyl oligopeptidase family serine peptidase [Phycisphaerales bacterium]|nr:prolyl oligopeptidase family serine peptidase [Phycisphaerales bacterium]
MRLWMKVLMCAAGLGCGAEGAQRSAPASAGPEPGATTASAPEVTLELIMRDPEWLGRFAEDPYWSADGTQVYYRRKRAGSDERDLWVMPAHGGESMLVAGATVAGTDTARGWWTHDRSRVLFGRAGDLYVGEPGAGQVRQLTRTSAGEFPMGFTSDELGVIFRRDGAVLVRALEGGMEVQPYTIESGEDPISREAEAGYLVEQQRRLFDVIRERRERGERDRKADRDEWIADVTRTPVPWYAGKDLVSTGASMSPDGVWVIAEFAARAENAGRQDAMPNYVTESGYVESRPVRGLVGSGRPRPEKLALLNLRTRERFELDLSVLPSIADDPLEAIREATKRAKEAAKQAAPEGNAPANVEAKPEAELPAARSSDPAETSAGQPTAGDAPVGGESKPEAKPAPKPKQPEPRGVNVSRVLWSRDGARAVVMCESFDNKDRWIAGVDLDARTIKPLEHEHDEAWISFDFAEMGFLRDDRRLWFLSERTGFSGLYVRDAIDGEATRLVGGAFEVSSVTESPDGAWLYYLANVHHPGEHEVWRVPTAGGDPEQMTRFGGQVEYALSPDGGRLLLRASSLARPPELFVQEARAFAGLKPLTAFASEAFTSIAWVVPEVVAVPGPGGPVYARVYRPASQAPSRPGAVFIHGAGYLQDAHKGWSYYFREFMFATMLCRAGYTVIDPDFRASAGYGRDWRTAIYRNMGYPEVDDLAACVAFLGEHCNVDVARVGCWGGSYGGFLTLMALFTRPEIFACGAALRPVTDWAHYNHGYTSNILNTPELDPETFRRCSPIEHAAGLQKPLLICHGMQDDNVFYQDTVRLAQRLVELHKRDWEVAAYPVEPHGFVEASSWYDEYRRIFELFERHLK